MTKVILIKTIDGSTYKYLLDDVIRHNFEYSPTILRIEFKNETFIEFTRQNVIFAGIAVTE